MTRTYQFQHCRVEVDYLKEYTETQFEDGTRVPACPERTPEYFATAARLGYGSDVAMLSREHEVLHTLIMERLGFPVSPTLWAVAHDFAAGTAPLDWQRHEEAVVCEFQRLLNTPALRPLTPACILGRDAPHETWVNWIDLKNQAWRLLREPEGSGSAWRARQPGFAPATARHRDRRS